MFYQQLLLQSEEILVAKSDIQRFSGLKFTFNHGGWWMQRQLAILDKKQQVASISNINFAYYGWLKYSISIFTFLVALILFAQLNIWLIPFAILFFYLAEIHFLFLFPLLIDGVQQPILNSLRSTYKVGIFHALFVVMPIAFFMIFGLLDLKSPFYKWQIGCLAILIWYKNEVRNRL